MTQIPFHQPVIVTEGEISRAELRTIAGRQRGLLFCIFFYILAVISQFIMPETLRPLLMIGVLAIIVLATIFVFMLAMKVFHPAVGVLLGILTLVPLLNLIVLVAVSKRTTGILRKHGVEVGVMGADPNLL